MKSSTTTIRGRTHATHRRAYKGRHARKSRRRVQVKNTVIFLITFFIALAGFTVSGGANLKEDAWYAPQTVKEPNNSVYASEPKSYQAEPPAPAEVLPTTTEFDPVEDEVDIIEISQTLYHNDPPPASMSPEEIMQSCLGNASIDTGNSTLTLYDLPSVYYPGLDFSSFQAWMPYTVITDKSSAAYKVISDDRMYVDENGMCRFQTTPDQFTIDGKDDFVIALGTYYKPKGTCGDRWLIVTTTGAYTAITGDEKDDSHTDNLHMYTTATEGRCVGMIEWLVSPPDLNRDIKYHGTVTRGPVEELHGEILYIYRIN